MAVALLCCEADLEADLRGTVLWRADFERHLARRLEDAQLMALTETPELVVVERELSWAPELVRVLRADPLTRAVSIAVVTRGEFNPREVELLEAGANAVLRLPVGPDWDERLSRLAHVPTRAEARCGVDFEVDATVRQGAPSLRGVALDLSTSGMLLLSPVELSVGEDVDFEVDATVRQGAPSLRGVALDLSTSGMLLLSPVELSVGEDVDFRFHLPGAGPLVAGCGRVVRQAGERRYGVEFYGLEGLGSEDVRRYVEALEPL